MKDFLNRQFAIDQKVVWPRRQGSRMWLNHGIISQIIPERGELIVTKETRTGPRKVTLQNLTYVCVLGELA